MPSRPLQGRISRRLHCRGRSYTVENVERGQGVDATTIATADEKVTMASCTQLNYIILQEQTVQIDSLL
ncbi:hypothetical protein M404DRAFT_514181 [Pisolithus tinctorius Marx 270]|uniref:Uncharacterized protein n=1 Tax=Pisolithus tinctorius Marx 270 TaxID=870435 RepID=A0A0C3J9H1_PISTI|nr:hypothetical protein M404DRAFT_514181 [Pisolithus tinctorius Marx 270]